MTGRRRYIYPAQSSAPSRLYAKSEDLQVGASKGGNAQAPLNPQVDSNGDPTEGQSDVVAESDSRKGLLGSEEAVACLQSRDATSCAAETGAENGSKSLTACVLDLAAEFSDTPEQTIHTSGYISQQPASSIASELSSPAQPDPLLQRHLKDDCFKDVYVNLMVAGMSGLGKTTCIQNMLGHLTPIQAPHDGSSTSSIVFETKPDDLVVESSPQIFYEKGCRVTYRIQDTPGWGNQVNIGHDIQAIIAHVQDRKKREMLQWNGHFYEPQDIEYKYMLDACLYFIPPHRFSHIDAHFIRELSSEVTVIPIIAKADSMTVEETIAFKNLIMDTLTPGVCALADLHDFDWQLPKIDSTDGYLGGIPPFAIIGSQQMDHNNLPVRKYPWGDCQICNEQHCDFSKLKRLLLNTGMYALRTRRHEHYVRYAVGSRAKKYVSLAQEASDAAQAAANMMSESTPSTSNPIKNMLAQHVWSAAETAKQALQEAHLTAGQAIAMVAAAPMRIAPAMTALDRAESAASRADRHRINAVAHADLLMQEKSGRKKGRLFGSRNGK